MTQMLFVVFAVSAVLTSVEEKTKSYTIGVQAVDYYPIAQANPPTLVFRGFARDVLDRFAQREGIKFSYVALPPKRLLIEYWSHRLDLIFPDNPNWDAALKSTLAVSYSNPVVSFGDAVFTLPSRGTENLDQLHTLSVLLGWTPWKFVDRIKEGKIRAVTAPSPDSMVGMVLAGRVDGANLAEPVARYHLRLRGSPDALVANRHWMPLKQSNYHLSSIQHTAIIGRFNQYLREDEPYLAKLRAQYGLEHRWP
jgi:polar amino acid transport system substrate-binding protein